MLCTLCRANRKARALPCSGVAVINVPPGTMTSSSAGSWVMTIPPKLGVCGSIRPCQISGSDCWASDFLGIQPGQAGVGDFLPARINGQGVPAVGEFGDVGGSR